MAKLVWADAPEIEKPEERKDTPSAVSPPPRTPSIIPTANFQIESLADRYRIHQVQYQDRLYTVDWSKKLLDRGRNHTQQEWIALTQAMEWMIPNMRLYHATLRALYNNREHPAAREKELVKKMRQLFKADFDPVKLYMSTGTRIKYAADGQDNVTHDYGYPSARKISSSLAGAHASINASSGLEEQMDALLGSRDLAEIEQVYEWASGKKPYLWRLNQSPAQDIERAMLLGCGGSGFNVDADDDLGNLRPARGVRLDSPGGTR